MLTHLSISNYALIEKLDIDLPDGFTVITGETGAGKSILLGAIGLLLGQRAETRSIRTGAQKCCVEAIFHIKEYNIEKLFEEMDIDMDGDECIIRRELSANGKSRAFINDTPASVTQLKQLGSVLIDIHSQHQNLLLEREDFQVNILDMLSGNTDLLAQYLEAYSEYKKLTKELDEARALAEKSRDEEDYLTFQVTQLEEAELKDGEDEELEQEQTILEHAEEIKSTLLGAAASLSSDEGSVLSTLRSTLSSLRSIENVHPQSEELASRLDSCLIELKDISGEIDCESENIEFDPQRCAYVQERLSCLYELEHKHHVDSVSELIVLRDELSAKLLMINNSAEHLATLQKKCEQALTKVMTFANKLSSKRQKAAEQMDKKMVENLISLGMPNIAFKTEVTHLAHPSANGIDCVNFLFSANKNSKLQPISQIASGGEIARVMLSLKYLISTAVRLPTIIFDEIDTGVSGKIAESMATIMQKMGETGHQVISITHLPQIASMGAHHYRVWKDDTATETNSHITLLNNEERIDEIAHMLSGSEITQAARANARSLLNL